MTIEQKAEKISVQGLDRLGQVGPYTAYEHPTLGDEAPMLVTKGDTLVNDEDFWEVTELKEALI